MKLEIAVVDLPGALIAAEEGANRVELCANLEVGGLTPSTALLESCRGPLAGTTEIHPIIRCRPGNFVYSGEELRTMAEQIASCAARGADGVVFGALTPDGWIDRAGTRTLLDAARWANPDMEITFHRAIDECRDPLEAIDLLAGLGFTRVLTSGAEDSVGAGLDLLARLVQRAAGRLQVMAGGGLVVEDIPALKAAGLDAVHLSARRKPAPVPAGAAAASPGVRTSTGTMPMVLTPSQETATDRELVKEARAASR
ncbi:copper homeostasis protein CutC [Arthrobacter rhombi]|uniref:copper homeostasis protein CutC n=1 Tax=Arthrobacter rhombi TaxID=71253 RepID=UPI003FD01AA8